MGYETQYQGSLTISPSLAAHHHAYLSAFVETRRMKRNAELTAQRPDPKREAVGLPVGHEGEYFVGAGGSCGQEKSADIVDFNTEPASQHGLWCGWVFSEFGEEMEPEDGKNYGCADWLRYLIERFLAPWGYSVSGKVRWRGEDFDDAGIISVSANVVTVHSASVEMDQ